MEREMDIFYEKYDYNKDILGRGYAQESCVSCAELCEFYMVIKRARVEANKHLHNLMAVSI